MPNTVANNKTCLNFILPTNLFNKFLCDRLIFNLKKIKDGLKNAEKMT